MSSDTELGAAGEIVFGIGVLMIVKIVLLMGILFVAIAIGLA